MRRSEKKKKGDVKALRIAFRRNPPKPKLWSAGGDKKVYRESSITQSSPHESQIFN
jgi:hypothetical protein